MGKLELEEVYLNYKKGTTYSSIKASNIGLDIDIYKNIHTEDFNKLLKKSADKISELNTAHFHYKFGDGNKDGDHLIRVVDKNPLPLQMREHEEKIQALRILRGMLYIFKTQSDDRKFADSIADAYKDYLYKDDSSSTETDEAKKTKKLAEDFALILSRKYKININFARAQVMMARDRGIALEHHPAIYTIVDKNGKIKIKRSAPRKVEKNFYENALEDFQDKPWFKREKQKAGFPPNACGTWLEAFYVQNRDDLVQRGVPAAGTSRSLPVPNMHDVETLTATKKDGDQLQQVRYSHFTRLGTLGLKASVEEAVAELRQVLETSQILERQREFNKIYNGLAPKKYLTFRVSYLNFLSPWYLEKYLYPLHAENNNARFVAINKAAMAFVAKDQEYKGMKFSYTNSAVNAVADWFFSHDSQSDYEKEREEKIRDVRNILVGIYKNNQNYCTDNPAINDSDDEKRKEIQKTLQIIIRFLSSTKQLLLEGDIERRMNLLVSHLEEGTLLFADTHKEAQLDMTMRVRGAFYMRRLMDGADDEYNELSTSEQNVMLAAYEVHCVGSIAGETFEGCKTARDRSAVVDAAAEHMQENPDEMYRWEKVKEGIKNNLMQGHQFLITAYHVALTDIKAVGKKFLDLLDEKVQIRIATLLQFAKFPVPSFFSRLGTAIKNMFDWSPGPPPYVAASFMPQPVGDVQKHHSFHELPTMIPNVMQQVYFSLQKVPNLPVDVVATNSTVAVEAGSSPLLAPLPPFNKPPSVRRDRYSFMGQPAVGTPSISLASSAQPTVLVR